MKDCKLEDDKLESIANRIRAIGHPQRIAIISLFNREDRLTVSQIQEFMNMGQAVTSNHLRILRDQKVVGVIREGKHKYYTLKSGSLNEVVSYLEE